MSSAAHEILHLRAADTSVIIDPRPGNAPAMLYWGPSLGTPSADELQNIVRMLAIEGRSADLDTGWGLTMVPLSADGWCGAPGVAGHRNSTAFLPRFECIAADASIDRAVLTLRDANTVLTLTITVEVLPSGLVRQRLTLTNDADAPYEVLALRAGFPVPPEATEILDFTGKWAKERQPQRYPFTYGRHVRTNHKGRPGPDAPLLLIAGTPGFAFERGACRAIHVAWSGNAELAAERDPFVGGGVLTGAEALMPGEMVLTGGASYEGPWVYASHGDGLDAVAARFHDFLRARPEHPTSPRPVILNCWEAVYFDHDETQLTKLAEAGAAIGVELFMLDDGWFLGRRHDRAGLGDWSVDPAVWPNGLAPFIDKVHALGMKFGIWVEPEMVNPDSDLARAHPEWILGPVGRMTADARQQQVVNLANPDAYANIFGQLDRLLGDHAIDYVKWDHNRELHEPGDVRTGRPVVHEQTRALYRLLDELSARHPNVEWENCASGGSRIDLEIVARTHRTWVSDCTDPAERAVIQQSTGLLLPLEMMGNDIATEANHQTSRMSYLDFRGGIALLGHLGIQLDLTKEPAAEIAALATWVELYKTHRALMHSGRAVNVDAPDASRMIRGVVARDRSHALFTIAQLNTSVSAAPGRVRFVGLDPDALYELRAAPTHAIRRGYGVSTWSPDGARLSGRTLDLIGIEAPLMSPEQVVVLSFERVG
ncbi:MAG TPA: alpha-galactosidase [Candidatus Lumbricidophila sp.]|nr:alpha-galactosidase [Candidatus Lumbricidophila sp.]